MKEKKPHIPPFIQRLMPNASEEEKVEAAERLRAYFAIVYRSFLEQERKRALDSSSAGTHGRFDDTGEQTPIV